MDPILLQYATSIIQNVYYEITIRAGDPHPQPPSPRYYRHRRYIFIVVIISYLLYTIFEAFYEIQRQSDFYAVLGVSPFADDKTVKSRFRRLAAQYHPDKVGRGDGGSNGNGNGNKEIDFVFLKLAHDTILDPARRFAYDRFGFDSLNWAGQQLMTERELLYEGLQGKVLHGIIGLVLLVVLSFIWSSNYGRYVSIRPKGKGESVNDFN